MLPNIHIMEAICIFYVKVGRLTNLEESKISFLTVNKTGTVRLTVQHNLIAGVSFMSYLRDCLRQISADVLSLVQYPTLV